MSKAGILLIGMLLPLWMLGQYNMGVGNSNYAGIHGALINPAGLAGSKLRWDLNGLSTGVLFDNTFVYVPRGAVPAFGFGAIIKGIIHEDKFATHFDPGNPGKLYNFTFSNEILGPSFQLALDDQQTIGLTIASRSYASIRNLPGHTAQNAYDYLLSPSRWNIPYSDHSSRLNGMSWLEYGFHYAAVLSDDGTNKWKGGVTLKYLQGVAAAYVKNTNLNYTIADTTGLVFTGSSVDYGRTDYDSYRKIHGYGDLNHGGGVGASLGIVYVHAADTRKEDDYQYRVGLSLLDIGAIHFSRNTAAYHLQTDNANFSDWRQVTLKSNVAVDRTLSAVFYQGDSNRSKVSDGFTMRMPTTLSLQADWKVRDNYFLNATIVKGIGPGGGQAAVQPDIYAITPRYEKREWEVSLPLSLLYYGQWRARLGIAARVWYFFFGGDAPFGLLGKSNMQGVDFYAGVHFFLPTTK